MKASNVALETLQAAAKKVGVVAEIAMLTKAGRTHRIKLRPLVRKEWRTPAGRLRRAMRPRFKYFRTKRDNPESLLSSALCWHGFRDFFRAVFAIEPSARFVTMLATYDGAADFERVFPDTSEKNIGSQFAPVAIADACRCERDTPYDSPEPSFGEWGVRMAPILRERERKRLAKLARNRARIDAQEKARKLAADRSHRRAVAAELQTIRAVSSIAALAGRTREKEGPHAGNGFAGAVTVGSPIPLAELPPVVRAPINASMSLDEIRRARGF
jgi:hypothetical protein